MMMLLFRLRQPTCASYVCLFMKMHLLALVQDNCLELVHCASLRKLSGCVRNITAFCQHLLRPFWLIPIYRQNPNIGQADISVYLYPIWIHFQRTVLNTTDLFEPIENIIRNQTKVISANVGCLVNDAKR